MPKYLVVYGEGDSWLTDVADVEGVIKEYNQKNIGGGYPIEHIYEMIDRTPVDITTLTTTGTETKEEDSDKGLPSWWRNKS